MSILHRDAGMVHRFGLMAQCIKDTGPQIKLMEVGDLSMQTATFMRESGKTTRLTVRVFTSTLTELNTTGTGKRISKMEKELKPGLMVLNTQATMLTAKSTAEECSTGQMAQNMRANSTTTIFMDQEFTNGLTEENMMVTGNKIKCTGPVFSNGKTGDNTKENIKMIKRKVEVPLLGLMAESMSETGILESNTERESILHLKVKLNTENGKTANELIG